VRNSLRHIAKFIGGEKNARQSAQFDLEGNGLALLLGDSITDIRKFVDDVEAAVKQNALDERRGLPAKLISPDYRL